MRAELEANAADLANVRFGDFVSPDRLGELLATGDLHVVPLRRGLAKVSVPSKTYTILAAGRPVLAAIDEGTAVPRLLAESGGGVSVAPDDADRFTAAVAGLVADGDRLREMGAAGRSWVEAAASPESVAATYETLIRELKGRR
jgi:colanic acid biosynthesis glycosyl transferase WcaI